jgi:hypothetical protein
MSKFENTLNALWETLGVTPPNGTPTTSNGTPSTAPAPTANNNVTGAPNPANANNPSNQQQPKTGTPNPANKSSISTDPKAAQTMQALAGTKTSEEVAKILADPNHQNVINGFIKSLTNK